MPKRDWRSDLALGGLVAAAAALALWGGFALWGYEREQGKQREQASQYEASGARGEIQATCVEQPRSRTHTCTANIPIADQTDPYAEHDLRAQQDMARWALAVVLVSIGTLALTGFGVLLLWWTLEATREAISKTAEATRAMREGERAWLWVYRFKIDPVSVSVIDRGLPTERQVQNGYRIKAEWRNGGRSIATQVRVVIRHKIAPKNEENCPVFESSIPEDGSPGFMGPGVGEVMTSGIFLDDAEARDFRERRTKVIIYTRAEYTPILGAETAHAEVCVAATFAGHQLIDQRSGITEEMYQMSTVGTQNTAT